MNSFNNYRREGNGTVIILNEIHPDLKQAMKRGKVKKVIFHSFAEHDTEKNP